MCSTPKPKRSIKAKTTIKVVGILSSMNSEARQRFATRANDASDRRIQLQNAKQNKAAANQSNISSKANNNSNNKRSWLYWIFSASFSEIFRKLFFRKLIKGS